MRDTEGNRANLLNALGLPDANFYKPHIQSIYSKIYLDDFDQGMLTALNKTESNNLVLDLSLVDHIDIDAWHIVVKVHNHLENKNGKLVIVDMNAKIKEEFNIKGFDQIIETRESNM
ncbi:MAG TPA: STAS domain-containing protein [Patescibacteria group bacterium]|nr:STAS domain-containing protein [Patescibacteria group bacterium]